MDEQSIVFDFEDLRSAYYAFDTLDELGYRPEIRKNESAMPQVHIHVENSDITSALEIAQAHGGSYVDNPNRNSNQNKQADQTNYHSGHIPIPAHIVNEDWTEAYAQSTSAIESQGEQEETSLYTPDESFDHMSADVRA